MKSATNVDAHIGRSIRARRTEQGTKEPPMTIVTETEAAARELAAELRAIHAGTDWTVRIERPLFEGDDFRVVVG